MDPLRRPREAYGMQDVLIRRNCRWQGVRVQGRRRCSFTYSEPTASPDYEACGNLYHQHRPADKTVSPRPSFLQRVGAVKVLSFQRVFFLQNHQGLHGSIPHRKGDVGGWHCPRVRFGERGNFLEEVPPLPKVVILPSTCKQRWQRRRRRQRRLRPDGRTCGGSLLQQTRPRYG